MIPNPKIVKAIEQLNYRVTLGDVAASAGLELNLTERGLLALASDAGGHLQVAETGDIVYQFPKNFQSILRNKYWKLRWQETWKKIWGVLFYGIRISFGIILIASILLIAAALVAVLIALSSSRDDDGDGGGGGMMFFPFYWFSDIFWLFSPNYGYYNSYDSRPRGDRSRSRQFKRGNTSSNSEMNFLEAVFSFIFGDGNPNVDKEERRWQEIGMVIRNHRGAVVAEQIAPYLDDLGNEFAQDYEEYMLPVLARFNGRPEVSPDGQLIYRFEELQTTASQQQVESVPNYFQERLWRFSRAGSSQLMMAGGLGALNVILALMLGSLLRDGTLAAQLGGLVAFAYSIYGLLLAYGLAFLAIPLVRYFWIQWRNRSISSRNQERHSREIPLAQPSDELQQKLAYAREFAAQNVIDTNNLAYTTETDLAEQEFNQADKIDAEWQRRLESGS